MAEYLHPGVYVEEVSSGVRPIEGVSTSTAAFVGITAKGIPNRATFITKWEDFRKNFGDVYADSYLPYAVSQFFDNGGKRCYVVRVLNALSATAANVTIADRQPTTRETLRIRAKGAGTWGSDLAVLIEDAIENPAAAFRVSVYLAGRLVEVFDNLSMNPQASNYVVTEVNDASEYITVEDLEAFQEQNAQVRRALWATTAAVASTVNIPAGNETFVITADAGAQSITLPTGAAVPRADVVAAINTGAAALGLSAYLNATNNLEIQHGAAGFDRYFVVSGNAIAAGQPLAGPTTLRQGRGRAIGATVKSADRDTFSIVAGTSDTLTFTVGVPASTSAFSVVLTPGTPTAAAIAAQLNAEFTTRNNVLIASTEGKRVVVATTNRGQPDNDLTVAGNANGATVLDFRPFDRSVAPTNLPGFGMQGAAFLQSAPAPFSVPVDSNFTIRVNNGALGALSADIVINFTTARFSNLAAITAKQLADEITAQAGAGLVTTQVVGDRVVVRQARRGNFYTLRLVDGIKLPNSRIKFQGPPPSPDAAPGLPANTTTGFAEGDTSSPYLRPALNLSLAGVNQRYPLTNGTDGVPVSDGDFIGNAADKNGLHALDPVTDVNIVAVPGNTGPAVINAAVSYCAARKDCVFVADAPEDLDASAVQAFVFGQVTAKDSYGALYYPWVEIADPAGRGRNPKRLVPPSGFVTGLYARIDNERGVWKAPAGTEATLRGPVLGLEREISDADQDILNPYGVNCLRKFAGAGIVIWGARTLGSVSNPEWRYLPVRRFAIYLEQSIYRGTQWAVFEPNDQPLWDSLRANIEDFLMGEFRKGALAGRTPEDAFAVKCDADLNPESERNAGRVNMEVKFAPLKPAEFVIIRISQKTQRPSA